MRYTITERNVKVTPGLKAAAEEKIGKLEHFFTPGTGVVAALSAQRDRQEIEVTIPVKGSIVRVGESSSGMYVSIDLVEEIIERQTCRYRERLIDKKQAAVSFSQALVEEEDEVQDDGIQIIKTKRLAIRPAIPEGARLQMEVLRHNFYMFLNANTDQMNAVYKRKNGTYGLIKLEP